MQNLNIDPVRLALYEWEEAKRTAEVRRLDYRHADDRTRQVEAALLYAQAADNEAILGARYEEMVMDSVAAEIARERRV